MAQPIGCDLCNANLASMLVTNLNGGDTLGICGTCVPGWARALADAMDPPKPTRRDAAAPATSPGNDGGAGAKAPRRPRGQTQRPTVLPGGSDDTGVAPAPNDATAD